jgi:hypothetical protein
LHLSPPAAGRARARDSGSWCLEPGWPLGKNFVEETRCCVLFDRDGSGLKNADVTGAQLLMKRPGDRGWGDRGTRGRTPGLLTRSICSHSRGNEKSAFTVAPVVGCLVMDTTVEPPVFLVLFFKGSPEDLHNYF